MILIGSAASAETSVDPARLARALTLAVERVEPGLWMVTGGRKSHWVDRHGCDCSDHMIRGRRCKHLLAVHLADRLDAAVLDALREVGEPPFYRVGKP